MILRSLECKCYLHLQKVVDAINQVFTSRMALISGRGRISASMLWAELWGVSQSHGTEEPLAQFDTDLNLQAQSRLKIQSRESKASTITNGKREMAARLRMNPVEFENQPVEV